MRKNLVCVFVPACAAALFAAGAAAQTAPSNGSSDPLFPYSPSLAMAQTSNGAKPQPPAAQPAKPQPAQPARAAETRVVKETSGESPFHYREISDFFNVREAYSNVDANEWEFEVEAEWATRSGESDEYGPAFSLKYGITNTLHAAIEVLPIRLGEGGDQGNGDIALIVFNEFWKETDWIPAFGAWLEGRFPTGEGSSGVDAEAHFNVTKQLAKNCRAHFEGFIMTANGSRGGDDDDRRDFQWGAGPGFDYSLSDDTIFAVNYLNRVSDEYGDHNSNVVEFGLAQRVAPNQHIKLAVDVGVDGQESTENLAAKLQWSIEW